MCVIVIGSEKAQSSIEELHRMEAANKDGAGIAWLTKRGKVRWIKGLDAGGVAEVLRTKVRGAWVGHFRFATVGGAGAELTHPFAVNAQATTTVEGESERVLFHNGHWSDWSAHAQGVSRALGVSLPDGPMSDSRAAAWIVAMLGEQFLDLLPGRWVLLDKGGARRWGAGWSERPDGTTVSNTNWCSWQSPAEGVAPIRVHEWAGFEAYREHNAEKRARHAARFEAAKNETQLVMDDGLRCKKCHARGGGKNPIGKSSGLCLGCIHAIGKIPRRKA